MSQSPSLRLSALSPSKLIDTDGGRSDNTTSSQDLSLQDIGYCWLFHRACLDYHCHCLLVAFGHTHPHRYSPSLTDQCPDVAESISSSISLVLIESHQAERRPKWCEAYLHRNSSPKTWSAASRPRLCLTLASASFLYCVLIVMLLRKY